MGKMIFTVLGAVAELERNLIRERVVMGLDRARKQRKQLGRPKTLFDRGLATHSFRKPFATRDGSNAGNQPSRSSAGNVSTYRRPRFSSGCIGSFAENIDY